MPWEVKKNGAQWCVYKKGASSPIKGGCHSDRSQAVKHMKALYSNVEGSMDMKPYKGDDGLWRIDRVPIISTGIEYVLASGPHTFIESELVDAVAAQDDPAIVFPRIKLGHSSEYNAALIGDAEQAFGRVENLEVDDRGHTIYGDYVGIPEWLAGVLPVAYPNRSIEARGNVETVTGKKYSMVISAVSLLGVQWPGCSVLEDLPMWYGAEIPEGVEIDYDEEAVAAGDGGGVFRKRKKVEAAVDVDQISRKFYSEVATGDNYWWWIRAIRYGDDGLQLIIDDNEDGDLYRMPVSVAGDSVEFGTATPVTVEYPDKVAAGAFVASMAAVDDKMVIYASREESLPKSNQEGAAMDDAQRQKLAAKLGLPEDATVEQINAKAHEQLLAEAPAADPPAEGEPPAEEEGNGDDDTPPANEPPAEEQQPAEQQASGPVTLDRGTFEQLKHGAELAAKHEKDKEENEIVAIIKEAKLVGKIPPAREGHYRKLFAADFDGTKKLIEELEPDSVPVSLRGANGNNSDEMEAGAGQGLPEGWFPEITAMREQAASGRRVMNAKEG